MDKDIRKAFDYGIKIKAEKGSNQMSFVMTTPSVDRDGEVVDPNGMVADAFLKNPQFLWNHDLFGPPLGNVSSLTLNKGQIEATVDWLTRGIYPFADTIHGIYEDDKLHAVSMRFKPLEWINGNPQTDGFKTKFTKWELIELSACNVPVHRDTLRLRSMGAETAQIERTLDWVKSIAEVLGPVPAETKTPPAPDVASGQAPATDKTTDSEKGSQAGAFSPTDDQPTPPPPAGEDEGGEELKAFKMPDEYSQALRGMKTMLKKCGEILHKMVPDEEEKCNDGKKRPAKSVADEQKDKTKTECGEPAKDTPGAEPGAKSKTDDGKFDLSNIVSLESPKPVEVTAEDVDRMVKQRVDELLAKRDSYLKGISALDGHKYGDRKD